MTLACDSQTAVFTRIQDHTGSNILLRKWSLAWTTIRWCRLGYLALDVQIHLRGSFPLETCLDPPGGWKKCRNPWWLKFPPQLRKKTQLRGKKRRSKKKAPGETAQLQRILRLYLEIKTSYRSWGIQRCVPSAVFSWNTLITSNQTRVAIGNSRFSNPLGTTGAVSKGKTIWTHLDARLRWQNITKP